MSIDFYILIHANIFCAEYQIKTIRKFCKDPFNIVILDSNCGEYPDLSKQLNALCSSKNIELLNIPNEFRMTGQNVSLILGTKLNYIYNGLC